MASENGQYYQQTVNEGSDVHEVHTVLQTPGERQRCRTTIYY